MDDLKSGETKIDKNDPTYHIGEFSLQRKIEKKGKIVKPLKFAKGVKNVPIIKTENVAGKPEWFDSLVNKVIVEGDDVTKRFATGERQSIHQKTLDDGSVVRVTEDTHQVAVRVEYESS